MKQTDLDVQLHTDLLHEIRHAMVFRTKTEHKQYIAGAKATLVKLQLPLAEAANCETYKQTD